jgi:hypothetical protein
VAVLNTGDVAPQKSGAPLSVALAQFLLFAKFAESVADHHAGIISKKRRDDKARYRDSPYRKSCTQIARCLGVGLWAERQRDHPYPHSRR